MAGISDDAPLLGASPEPQPCKDVLIAIAKLFIGLIALVLSPILIPLIVLSARCCPTRFVRFAVTNVPGASWQQGDIPGPELQESHKSAPLVERLPDIAELISFKYRTDPDPASTPAFSGTRTLKLLQWNIFLGQNLDALIAECRRIDNAENLDLIVLSEDNIFRIASREKGEYTFHSVGAAIAKAVGMDYVFTPMYYRKNENGQRNGCYGASILSKHALQRTEAIRAAEQPAVVMEALSAQGIEGYRHFPYAELEVQGLPRFGIVSVHLPSCGKLCELVAQFEALCNEVIEKPLDAMIIAGDMNTFDFKMRYIPITGRSDIVFSCESEQAVFRKAAQQKSFEDPFKDTAGTHQSLPGKLDWTFANPAFMFKRYEIEPRTETKAEQPSDHVYSLVELEAASLGP